jgi:N-acetylmuramoyl-L-alanine amidase
LVILETSQIGINIAWVAVFAVWKCASFGRFLVKTMKLFCVASLFLLALFQNETAVNGATYGQEVVAAVLIAEARGEGEKGMMAVAEVIRRRADLKGVTMLSVIEPGTFTSLNGTDRDALLEKYHKHPSFKAALRIARRAYNRPESLGNLTRGATHFAHKKMTPWWARGENPVVTIGNHTFYKLARL